MTLSHSVWKRLVLMTAAVVPPSAVLAQSTPPVLQLADTLPIDPDVRRGQLPNGFQYFILQYPEANGEAELRLVVNAGRFHEDPDQLGLAHLLEHMAFNGTRHFPRIRENFQKWGFVPGQNWNGGTGLVTDCWIRFPTDRPALTDSVFLVMRDWAQDLALDSTEIDAERGVVLAEGRKDESAEEHLQREKEARLLSHPNYLADWHQKRDANIRTFTHDKLRRFLRDWYRPDLEALIVVGDVDPDDVEHRIQALFSDLKGPANPREPPDIDEAYAVPLTGKNHFLVLTAEALSGTTVWIYHKRKARRFNVRTVADYRTGLIEKLYDAMMEARFSPLTQQYNAPFRSVHHSMRSYVFRPSARIGGLETSMSFGSSQPVTHGIRAALLELERVRRFGFAATELEKARESIRTKLVDRRPVSLGELTKRLRDHYADGAAAPDLQEEAALRAGLLDEIDLETVNDLVHDWLGLRKNRDVVIVAPKGGADRLPTEEDVSGWFDELRSADIAHYRETKPPFDRLMSDAEIAALRYDPKYETRYNDEVGTTELHLANGTAVILKPLKQTESGADKFLFSGSSPGGIFAYEPSRALVAAQAASIVANAGVGKFDRFELDTFLKSKRISGEPGIGGNAANISGSGPANELEAFLQLVHLYLTVPRRDTAAFRHWKSHQLSRIEARNTHPVSWFESVIDTIRYPKGAPTRLITRSQIAFDGTVSDIQQLREDDAYRIYEDRFLKPGEFTFALAGDFDPGAAVPLLARYLGSLPATKPLKPEERSRHKTAEARSGNTAVKLYRGNDDKAEVRLYLSGNYTPTLMARAQLDVLSRALAIRIHERIREQEGGTYGTLTSVDPGRPEDATYNFWVSFIAAPDQSDHLIAAAIEEMERLRDEGLDDALFDAAIKRSLDRYADRQMKSPSFWTTHLVEAYQHGRDPADILKWRGLLKDILTREMMNNAARRYFRTDNLMRFVLLPAKYQPGTQR